MIVLHVVTSCIICSISFLVRPTPRISQFMLIRSSAKFTLHSSPSGILLYTSPRVQPITRSCTLVFPVTFIRLRKFLPVVDRHSLFSVWIVFLSTLFFDDSMLLTNLMNLSNSRNFMCLPPERGSRKYLWACRGSPSRIRCETFHVLSRRSASFPKRSQRGLP